MRPFFAPSNLVMVYLLGVVAVAAGRAEAGPSVLASVLGVLAFDFLFIPPRFSFSVDDVQYVFTFAVMLAAGLLVSGLMLRLRLRAEWARRSQGVTAALYALNRTLSEAHGRENIVREAARHLASVFDTKVAMLLPDEEGKLVPRDVGSPGFPLDEHGLAVAAWSLAHTERAGRGTATLPSAAALYQPLRASRGAVGVIGLQPAAGASPLDVDQLHLLETFSNQVALAIERVDLAARARTVEMQVEVERLRNSLLSAVSHDLRTPLASIMGSSSTLLEGGHKLTPETRRELTEAIYDEAERLNRLVANLLDVTRLEAGAVVVRREWQPLEEIVGVVLNRMGRSLDGHPLTTRIPADLPLVPVDAALIEQVLFNLVDNAARHTPTGTPIEVAAEAGGGEVVVSVADTGPGVPAGEEERIFERFQRGPRGKAGGGIGLGLTVSRGVVVAHGGRIRVERRPGGGAVFRFTLPVVGEPPSIPPERPLAAAVEASGKEAGKRG
jgi:two-component system sensor histidine kinase KdpD